MWNRHIKVPKIAPEHLFLICPWIVVIPHFSVLIKSIFLKPVQLYIHVMINSFYILQTF
jgi:hypothetical protein